MPDNPPAPGSPISATSGRPPDGQTAGQQTPGGQPSTDQLPGSQSPDAQSPSGQPSAAQPSDPVLSNPPGESAASGAPVVVGGPGAPGGPGHARDPGAPGGPGATGLAGGPTVTGHRDPRISDTSYLSGTSPPQPVPTPGLLFPNLADPAHPNAAAGPGGPPTVATGPVPVGSPSDPSAPVNTIGSATPMVPVGAVPEGEPAPTFFSLYHAASVPNIPWPKAVQDWAKDKPEHGHVLDTLKWLGERSNKAEHSAMIPFIEKLMEEVGGAK